MSWIQALVRVVGSTFPATAWLVQLHSEIESNSLNDRVSLLEDPISALHEDIPKLAGLIYGSLKSANERTIELERPAYQTYKRPLAALKAEGLIKANHTINVDYAEGITLDNPVFLLYMAALYEKPENMDVLVQMVDACGNGEHLNGKEISSSLDLPVPVIRAIFDVFESKGYGLCSPELGACQYTGIL